MIILVTGKNGQVGHELERRLHSIGAGQTQVVALDRSQMNLADPAQVREVIRRINPSLIVNAAAYTMVDLAEQECDMAMRINAEAVDVIAQEARRCGAVLIHYSTDHVFDGTKNSPYVETDPTCPINAYGRSKLAGEAAIQSSGVLHLILRTSWVYGAHGRNFMKTIQRLASQSNEIAVVDDQFGAPTWSRTVAQQTADAISQLCCSSHKINMDTWKKFSGVYHLTAQGYTSWHGLASAIVERGSRAKLVRVKPIASENYPTVARRPRNSRLSCERFMGNFGILPAWDTALATCMDEAE